MHGISIKAEPVFEIAGFPVTNAMTLGLIGALFVSGGLLFVAVKV